MLGSRPTPSADWHQRAANWFRLGDHKRRRYERPLRVARVLQMRRLPHRSYSGQYRMTHANPADGLAWSLVAATRPLDVPHEANAEPPRSPRSRWHQSKRCSNSNPNQLKIHAEVAFNFAGCKLQHLERQSRLHANPESVVHHIVGIGQVAADAVMGALHVRLAGQITCKQ